MVSFHLLHRITRLCYPSLRHPVLRLPQRFSLRMASTFPNLPIFQAIASHNPHSTAIIHSKSRRGFTYGELLTDVERAKIRLYHRLRDAAGAGGPIGGQRVAFLVENGYDYVVTLLAIFACDGIAVPLISTFPDSELRYIVDNSQPLTVLASHMFVQQAQRVLGENGEKRPPIHIIEKILEGGEHDDVQLVDLPVTKGGLMLYTSGTTSRPKGVVLNTATLTAQCLSLLKAWRYTTSDHVLHILPLHHIHGTVNALFTPLFAGSAIEFLFPFNPTAVWERLAAPYLPSSQAADESSTSSNTESPQKAVTFVSAVPTIYTRLLSTHPTLTPEVQSAARTAISPNNLRLNISGSAALPTPVKQSWSELSNGNVLLERYGMTEVGMALSCGLDFRDRIDGSVGWPLPGVEVRLVDTDTGEVIPVEEGEEERPGEIQLRGDTVFGEYWRNEEATREEFTEANDGGESWFKTGDVAVRRWVERPPEDADKAMEQDWVKGPAYFIQGRKSTDIIKTGGEKVSALEIERELLSLPQISEASVIGLPSEQWGQKVYAVVVLNPDQANTGKGGKQWGVMDMRRVLKDRLANYKIPQDMKVVGDLGRNAMGKVNKKALLQDIMDQEQR